MIGNYELFPPLDSLGKWAAAWPRTCSSRRTPGVEGGTPSDSPAGLLFRNVWSSWTSYFPHALPVKCWVKRECSLMMVGESRSTESISIFRAPWGLQGVCKFYCIELIGISDAKILEFGLSLSPLLGFTSMVIIEKKMIFKWNFWMMCLANGRCPFRHSSLLSLKVESLHS